MTKLFRMKYLKQDRGAFKYRRRVPKELVSRLGKSEFVKSLGRTEQQAVVAYPAYHNQVEREIGLAQLMAEPNKNGEPTRDEIIEAVIQVMKKGEFDLYSDGVSENEREVRAIVADQVLSKYPVDEETGNPDPRDVSVMDHQIVSALYGGLDAVDLPFSINDAFDFYAAEKAKSDPAKEKAQAQRLARVRGALLKATGGNIQLRHITRDHARSVRDAWTEKGNSYGTVQRNLGVAKAVLNFAIDEKDLGISNPFVRIMPKGQSTSAIDLRNTLPAAIITAMYHELADSPDLLDAWTGLHWTGCQSAELLGAKASDVVIDAQFPHLMIRPNQHREVKTKARVRNIPLVGRALETLRRKKSELSSDELLFRKYVGERGPDNFSQQMMERLRKHTSDPKHAVYSLRHNLKDLVIESGANLREHNAIFGHASGSTAEAGYGSRRSLEQLTKVMRRVEPVLEAEASGDELPTVDG